MLSILLVLTGAAVTAWLLRSRTVAPVRVLLRPSLNLRPERLVTLFARKIQESHLRSPGGGKRAPAGLEIRANPDDLQRVFAYYPQEDLQAELGGNYVRQCIQRHWKVPQQGVTVSLVGDLSLKPGMVRVEMVGGSRPPSRVATTRLLGNETATAADLTMAMDSSGLDLLNADGALVLRLHEGAPAKLGRSQGNALVVENTQVSRVHAAIGRNGGQWFVEDLSSTNGTWVDGVRTQGKVHLRDGQELHLGGRTGPSWKVRLDDPTITAMAS